MGNLHRIQWIDGRIRAGQHPNCTAIAAQFEISVRQAARDIEYMRDSLGAPIRYSAPHNGYVYASDKFRLPQVALTVEDQDTLRLLSTQYRRSTSQEAVRLAELFSRLSDAQLRESRDERMAPADTTMPGAPVHDGQLPGGSPALPDFPLPGPEGDAPLPLHYRQLDLALQLRRKVELTYEDARHRVSRRIIHPWLLFLRNGTPYLAAHCELRRAERVFLLSRILHVETLRAGYTIPDTFSPDTHLPPAQGPLRNPHTARVWFPAGLPAPPRPLHVREVGDGVLEMDFQHSRTFLSWLMSQAPGYRLLSPRWLREQLRQSLAQVLADHPEV